MAAVFIYESTRPPPQHLTQRDINAAVGRALASATPMPSQASQVYAVIQPSVVRVEAVAPSAEEGKARGALGTGVVIADDGTILTSLHVVQAATAVRVTFADGTEADAGIVLSQPENDLAVLRVNVVPDDLVPAVMGSSTMLRVGDEVFAVGNPFGISDSLSAGVVSGLRRSFKPETSDQTLSNLIQFDTAVNPGNSGGPLVDRNGEVVGIVTGLLNPTEDDVFIGIGFAVTIETAGGAAGAPPV